MRASFLPLLAVACAMACIPAATGGPIASDSASNPPYADQWQLTGGKVGTEVPPPGPDNGGFGFGTWVAVGSYNATGWSNNNAGGHLAAHFIDTAPLAGNSLGAPAFTISGQANGFHGQTIGVTRAFAAPMTVGDTFMLDFDNPASLVNPSGGNVLIGIAMENAANQNLVKFVIQGGVNSDQWWWSKQASGGVNDIGVTALATSDGTSFSFMVTGADTADVVLDGTSFSTSGFQNTGPVASVRVFTQTLGNTENGTAEVYFNNLKIVPEPSAMSLMLLGAVGLAVRRLRRTIG